jgi:murein DD-endopeptidase MepM/ murein hydrolase activator NlpD
MSRVRIALGILLVALAILSPTAARLEPWRWPVGVPRTVLRPYVAPATPYSAGHRGIDLVISEGLVMAPANGTVHFAGVVVNRPVVSIDHGEGVISSYEPVTTDLKKGDPVSRGDPIGQAIPGHCSVLCVHFGVRIDGEYISPLSMLDEIPYAVLLPTRR